MSVNKVILVGNVGKDPEVRYLEGGSAVCKFPLATSETYKNKSGERISTTEWHNIVLWRGLAEIAEKYVKKGNQLYIEGRIRTMSYTDKEGNTRYITEITGDNMTMLGKRSDEGSPESTNQSQTATETPKPTQQQSSESKVEEPFTDLKDGSDEVDDLPF